MKDEVANEGDQGPLGSKGSVQGVVGSLGVIGVFKTPPSTLEFLAPTGAQDVTISVYLSLAQSVQEAVNLTRSESNKSTKLALRE